MFIVDQANVVLSIFVKEVHTVFPERIISIFLLGSLNTPEIFSSCSDVDVAIMLDNLQEKDSDKINHLQTRIANLGLPFSDRLSVFWSSYNIQDFISGKGRFPALDRLILIKQASFISGDDQRESLPKPTYHDIVTGGVDFILKYMLPENKLHELLNDVETIINKGARYFTKFVLFPVRLIFSLDNPNMLASNLDAVNYLCSKYTDVLSKEILSLVNTAYQCRKLGAKVIPEDIDPAFLQKNLCELYVYCLQRYYNFMFENKLAEHAKQLAALLVQIKTEVSQQYFK